MADMLLEQDPVEEKTKKKKKYIDNKKFEELIESYQKTKADAELDELYQIFKSITERVYGLAIRNIYNNIGGIFPYPNVQDKEDLVQHAIITAIRALAYWDNKYKNDRNEGKKSKAFNYFTCCIVYSIQNDLKRELKKGWWKSDIFMKNFLNNLVLSNLISQVYIDYDNIVDKSEIDRYSSY